MKTKEKNKTLFALVLAFFHFEFVFKDTSFTTQHPYMIRHTFVIRKYYTEIVNKLDKFIGKIP